MQGKKKKETRTSRMPVIQAAFALEGLSKKLFWLVGTSSSNRKRLAGFVVVAIK
jgi:hypothetical protein